MPTKKKNPKKKSDPWEVLPGQDPADGTRLSVRQRLELAGEISFFGEQLVPQPRYRPFVKSFDSLRAYESWRKKQSNPWLV